MSTSSEHLEWTAPEQFGTAVVTCTPCVLFWKHTHSLVIPPFVLAWLLDWWTQWRRWLITKWVRHLVKLVQIPFHFNSCSRAESLFCHRAKQSLVLFFTTRVKLGFFFFAQCLKLRTGLRETKFEYVWRPRFNSPLLCCRISCRLCYSTACSRPIYSWELLL